MNEILCSSFVNEIIDIELQFIAGSAKKFIKNNSNLFTLTHNHIKELKNKGFIKKNCTCCRENLGHHHLEFVC